MVLIDDENFVDRIMTSFKIANVYCTKLHLALGCKKLYTTASSHLLFV